MNKNHPRKRNITNSIMKKKNKKEELCNIIYVYVIDII